MAGPAAVMFCVLFVFLPLALLLGSALLRAAVSLSNSIRGVKPKAKRVRRAAEDGDDWDGPDNREDDRDYDDFDPDDRPAEPIPLPSLRRGMGIALVNGLIGGVIGVVIGVILGAVFQPANPQDVEMVELVANAVSAPIGFLVSCVVLMLMLPTTFARAALVTVVQYAIVFVIAAVLVIFVLGVMLAMKP